MLAIGNILAKFASKIDHFDLELIIAHALKKPREFVLAHPEYKLSRAQKAKISHFIALRGKNMPLAYILGHKEFFGLDFKVTKDTLVPRPETELLVELALKELKTKNYRPKISIMDVGTGSGNIIISISKHLIIDSKFEIQSSKFYATDISKRALSVARQNAKKHGVDKRIKFLHGDLLDPISKNDTRYAIRDTRFIILANLPYLSKKIYSATAPNVKNFEPRSALVSGIDGLDHYKKLLTQVSKLNTKYKIRNTTYIEISPEQRIKISKLTKKTLPGAKVSFFKDLAGKWRVCRIEI